MAQLDQLAGIAIPGGDITVKNYGVSDIAEGLAVILDTTNTPDGGGTPIGVTLPASDVKSFGIAVTSIPAGKFGTVRVLGVAIGTASGTIHMGDFLMTDSAGKVLVAGAGKYTIGQAMSEAVTTDRVAVLIAKAVNA